MFAALGIILLIGGAVLAFAIDLEAEGVDLVLIGWIMIAGGGVALVVAMIQGAGFMSLSKSRIQTESHRSSDGRDAIEETETT